MHEAGAIQGLVADAATRARLAGAGRVVAVTLRVADPHHTTPEAIRFHFALATQDTSLHGARLILSVAERRCPICGADALPELAGCPDCGFPLPPPEEPELALEALEWE